MKPISDVEARHIGWKRRDPGLAQESNILSGVENPNQLTALLHRASNRVVGATVDVIDMQCCVSACKLRRYGPTTGIQAQCILLRLKTKALLTTLTC